MRTPVIAISLLGAAVLSPTFAAPTTSPAHHTADTHTAHRQVGSGGVGGLLAARSLSGLGLGELVSRAPVPTRDSSAKWSIAPREFWKKIGSTANLKKRLGDDKTMGGNAHSGSSGAVNGGSVYNSDPTQNEGMPVIMNLNSNNAGLGGESTSGCAASGKSGKAGLGGNASSGNSGNAMGGSVDGPPSGMFNMNSNNAGTAGESLTGCATGGDTYDPERDAVPSDAVDAEESSFEGPIQEDHIPFSNEQQ
ncbi:hypothetical protein BXZ70DRAFT_937887 [Cristinia sonorae]|uniref:Uncharacterized protein n=1 Tax=Cristinia sonorae TaxID=1940300 RepID=A0A8K0UND2_9AGAR|nr:hypothetical protein BXZ70DRAFT_937887 [Cristinia sonorae]